MISKSQPANVAPLFAHSRVEQPQFEVYIGGRLLPSRDPNVPQANNASADEANRIEQEFGNLREDLLKSQGSTIRSLPTIQNAITLRQAIDGYSAQLSAINLAANQWRDLVSRLMQIEVTSVGDMYSSTSKLQAEREMAAWQAERKRTPLPCRF